MVTGVQADLCLLFAYNDNRFSHSMSQMGRLSFIASRKPIFGFPKKVRRKPIGSAKDTNF